MGAHDGVGVAFRESRRNPFVLLSTSAVLISARYLVDRLRHPRSRADDVAHVRRRLAAATGSPEERALAAELRRLREELAAAFQRVDACGSCARGHPLPHGRFPGGHCCGTRTEQVFTDDEVAALALAGTSPGDLAPPTGDHAGCAFRGPEGCSLAAADRPSICVRYICRELEAELRERGDLARIKAIAASLARTFDRFRALREARLAREVEEP
jgi:hypothetical protein